MPNKIDPWLLDTHIWIRLVNGDPANRLIAATTRCRDATLVTFDQALLDYGKEGWIRAHAPGSSS